MKIRNASNKDSADITSLIFNIWHNEYDFNINADDYPDLVDIRGQYHKKGGIFLVAEIHNSIIGTIACVPLNQNNFVLKRMFVDKKYRQKGVAQALLDKLLTAIKTKTTQKNITISLSTDRKQAINAQKFYLKMGLKKFLVRYYPKIFLSFLGMICFWPK